MKSLKPALKLIAFMLLSAMLLTALASCGSSPVMTLDGENGKTFTISKDEVNFLMVYTKQSIFLNAGINSSYDSGTYIWDVKTTDDDTVTYDQYYTENAFTQLRTMVIEKYLFDKYNLKIADDTVKTIKTQIESTVKEHGGSGAFKQYYGYTSAQFLEYQLAVERSKALLEYYYGENGVEKVTDEELEKYYTENYTGYQYIMLDMKNKVTTDENGNRVLDTETGTDGKVTTLDKYKTTEMTDDEAEEKQLLPAKILEKINAGDDFSALAALYSDDYYAVKYQKGVFVLSSSSLIDDADATEKINALKVGEHTEALSVGDGEYTYIVKKIDLADKIYEDEAYADLFDGYKDSVEYQKYDVVIEAFDDAVKVDETVKAKYSMKTTFLSKYVDYYYKYKDQLSSVS